MAWVPTTTFTTPINTTTLLNAQSSNFVSGVAATVATAVDGSSYTAGDYIQVEQIDALRGVVTLTYLVNNDFTYSATEDFSSVTSEVSIFNETSFSSLTYRYNPRFSIGEYLLDRSTGLYYQALKSFTPYTQTVATMVTDSFLLPISFTPTTSRAIFRLIVGDVISLISGRVTKQYEVTQTFTPIFEPSVYIDASQGFLVERNDLAVTTADYYDQSYNIENIVYTESPGFKFYRTLKPFTASEKQVDFTGSSVTNSARTEELNRNLLQILNKAKCDESVYSRTGDGASLTSLGLCDFKFVPDNGLQFITQIVTEDNGDLSYSPSLKNMTPIDYGEGTFSL